jgi:hypothetical protein
MTRKAANVDYQKPRVALSDRERRSVDVLSRNGLSVIVRAEDLSALSNIDFEMNGFLYEEKSPDNTGIANIDRNNWKAENKWKKAKDTSPIRIVYSNVFGVRPDDIVFADVVKASQDHGVTEVLFINKNESLRRIII